MPMPTPPRFLNSNTRIVCFSLPSDGVNVISKTPGFDATKSVALYCFDKTTANMTEIHRMSDIAVWWRNVVPETS